MSEINYLTQENASFWKTPGGMLAVQVGEETYPTVYLHCSFPHTDKKIYVSVRTDEHKEVGMLRSLDDFPEDIAKLLESFIHLRYFAPQITKVLKITEEFGYAYWEAETEAGACRFTVRSGGTNLKMVTENKLMITDVDGNRFMIDDIEQISEKEYRMIEMCM